MRRALRGRSFASAREAKLAVEDLIRRQNRKVTLEDLAARSNMAPPKVERMADQITNLRERAPSTLTPEEAEANRIAVEAVQPKQRPLHPDTPRPAETPEFELTPEGNELINLRSQVGGPHTVVGPQSPRNAYRQAYAEWNRQLAMAEDATLTQAERNAAKRQAKTLGGEFTQTTGKHYKRHSAENIMIEDALWEADRQADPAWAAANQAYNDAIAATETQVEAMVYVKHHNPVTGEDVYTRAPDTSIGFGEGEVREPVPVEVPTQGAAPQGTMRQPEWVPPESPYTPEQRAADRAILDDPSLNVIMPEHQRQYGALVERSEKIAKRITDAEANQARLDELDEAAKAAYTAEVRQADEIVKQAKRAEASARSDWRSETLIPGAKAKLDAAERVTAEAVEAQTAARQGWMEADRALRDAVAEKEAYEKLEQQAVKAEQALYHKGANGDANVKAIKGERPEGWDGDYSRPLPLISDGKGNMVPQHPDVLKSADSACARR